MAYSITRHIEILNTLSHYYPEDSKYHEKLHARWTISRTEHCREIPE